ncbi:hypothetical protein [Haloparvum sedimenti]|uniref:hypothetical protein n=1 Tax=Haloparvum sedimenti TaxID=1678448 RepID=UPI001FE1CF0B|nr:hypothetical protein [Haloparvum sedimenti]
MSDDDCARREVDPTPPAGYALRETTPSVEAFLSLRAAADMAPRSRRRIRDGASGRP